MARTIYITDAKVMDDYQIKLTFNDGKTQTINIIEFIKRHPHPQYNKYIKPENIKKFHIENGNIVWGKNWDLIFPVDQLYLGNIS